MYDLRFSEAAVSNDVPLLHQSMEVAVDDQVGALMDTESVSSDILRRVQQGTDAFRDRYNTYYARYLHHYSLMAAQQEAADSPWSAGASKQGFASSEGAAGKGKSYVAGAPLYLPDGLDSFHAMDGSEKPSTPTLAAENVPGETTKEATVASPPPSAKPSSTPTTDGPRVKTDDAKTDAKETISASTTEGKSPTPWCGRAEPPTLPAERWADLGVGDEGTPVWRAAKSPPPPPGTGGALLGAPAAVAIDPPAGRWASCSAPPPVEEAAPEIQRGTAPRPKSFLDALRSNNCGASRLPRAEDKKTAVEQQPSSGDEKPPSPPSPPTTTSRVIPPSIDQASTPCMKKPLPPQTEQTTAIVAHKTKTATPANTHSPAAVASTSCPAMSERAKTFAEMLRTPCGGVPKPSARTEEACALRSPSDRASPPATATATAPLSLATEEAARVVDVAPFEWQEEQRRLAAAAIYDDEAAGFTMPWAETTADFPPLPGLGDVSTPAVAKDVDEAGGPDPMRRPPNALRYVGGLDISFVKGTDTAVASLVVLEYPSLNVIHELMHHCTMPVPYIAGYLAFREVDPLRYIVDEMRRRFPAHLPQVYFVDGNGLLHYRRCGLATHLGVLLNAPTVGCAKNCLHVDGVNREDVEKAIQTKAAAGALGDAKTPAHSPAKLHPLVGRSGFTWGYAALTGNSVAKPIYISPGHRISCMSAARLALTMTPFRVVEPIRQADLRSRQYIRDRFRPGTDIPIEDVGAGGLRGPRGPKKKRDGP